MQKEEGRCVSCGSPIVWRKTEKGWDFYHCSNPLCKETRFYYLGIQRCGDRVPVVHAKNGFNVGYCAKHGVKTFRLPRKDIWDKLIETDTMLL